MKKITREQMVGEIWDARSEQIVSIMAEKAWISCPYTFENFRADMRRRELVVDEKTLRTKWEIMVLGGIIRETGKNRGELAFAAFRDRMPSSARMMLARITESKTSQVTAPGVRA